MRRAPAKPVRACILRKWCPGAHVAFEAPLCTSHFSLRLHTPHFTLHTPHPTLHTAFFALHTSHFTLHFSHSTCHTSHFTVHTSHFSLLSSHSTLHTALFTPHTSHCTLHTPHFISSELFSPYPSSSLLMCHLSFHESLPSTTTKELDSCFLACTANKDSTLAAPKDCNSTLLRSRISTNLSIEQIDATHSCASYLHPAFHSSVVKKFCQIHILAYLYAQPHMSSSNVDFCIAFKTSLLFSSILIKR